MDPNQDDQSQNPGVPADDGIGGQTPAPDTDTNPAPVGGDAPAGGMDELPPSPPVVEEQQPTDAPADSGSEEPAGDTNPAA